MVLDVAQLAQLYSEWLNWRDFGNGGAIGTYRRAGGKASSMTSAGESLYPERESKNLEFKSRLPDFRKLVKTCVAFANGSGGEIVVGVEDGTRRVIGVDDASRDRIYDDFPNSVYDSVSPVLIPQIIERNIAGTEVIAIRVYPGTKKPYHVRSEGYPRGVYVRIGTSTRNANEEILEDLVREQRRIAFDEEPSGNDRSVLSTELLRQFYGGQADQRRLLDDRILVAAGGDRVNASNAGILMFCDKPDDYIHEATVLCTRFAGSEGRNIVETTELTGPIPRLLASANVLALSYLERDYALRGPRLSAAYLVPAEAVREAISNALIHRKYTVAGPVKIARYDDRLEIFSPGAFPGTVSLSNLGDGTTVLRNTLVARIARKMKLMEKLGTGIRLMFDSCRQAGVAAPEFSEDGDFVKVAFRFGRDPDSVGLDRERLLKMVHEEGVLRPRDLAKTPGSSRRSTSRMLSTLAEQGAIIRHGSGAGVYYTPGTRRGHT
jgi:ATP-dependent DNA helicase RecG